MSRSRGFTLIEMLVVMAIVGILATAVTLSLSAHGRAQAEMESQRLHLLLELAASQSRWGSPLAWSWSEDGYRFLRADDRGGWQPLDNDEYLHPRRLPQDVRISAVALEAQRLASGDPLPFAGGQMPPFHITLQTPEGIRRLEGRLDGKVVEHSP